MQDVHGNLRQMIAVLEAERQALATLEADKLFAVTAQKDALCEKLMGIGKDAVDEETRALVQTAKSLNDVNRRVRNLLAANVSERLGMLTADSAGMPARPAYNAQRAS